MTEGWLVLTRTEGEMIRIGEDGDPRAIWIRVMEIRGGQVRIGIDAPRDIPVVRVRDEP